MGSPVMTYQLAMAASFDAAERRRRQAGRTSWNAADRACAAEAFKRCIPLMPPHETFRQGDRRKKPPAASIVN
jgi:hypothetical protein